MREPLERAIARFRLAMPTAPFSGAIGGRLGRATGASLDFADFRDYVPGDDPRRVDWRAYARTDQLKIRLHRDEVAPALDLCVDASASLAVTPEKERAARDLIGAFCAWGVAAGTRPRTLRLGGDVVGEVDELAFDARTTSLAPPAHPLRPRGLRVVVSDFLTPEDPAPFLRRVAGGSAQVIVVQILDRWESDPSADGSLALVDVETGGRRDLRFGPAAIRSYRERLDRLCAAVEGATRGIGARFARVVADEPEAMFAGPLLRAGITEPR